MANEIRLKAERGLVVGIGKFVKTLEKKVKCS